MPSNFKYLQRLFIKINHNSNLLSLLGTVIAYFSSSISCSYIQLFLRLIYLTLQRHWHTSLLRKYLKNIDIFSIYVGQYFPIHLSGITFVIFIYLHCMQFCWRCHLKIHTYPCFSIHMKLPFLFLIPHPKNKKDSGLVSHLLFRSIFSLSFYFLRPSILYLPLLVFFQLYNDLLHLYLW